MDPITEDTDMERQGQEPQRGNDEATPTGHRNRKLMIIVAAFAVVAVSLSVGLGVGFSNDKKSASSADTASGKSTSANSEGTTTKETSDATGSSAKAQSVSFVSSLAAISPQTINESYNNCSDLHADLKANLRIIANSFIESNALYFENGYMSDDYMSATARNSDSVGDTKQASSPATAPLFQNFPTMAGQSKAGEAAATGANSYGTNNQRDGVEEGDYVQSNGVQVFASYGFEIVVLDADTMTVSSRTEIPHSSDPSCGSYVYGMLLVEDSLVVFADYSCYNETSSTSYYSGVEVSSKLWIYDTADMSLRTTEQLAGSYVSSRAVGSNVHVVTSAYINPYLLTQYLEVYYIDNLTTGTLNETIYRKKALEQLDLKLDSLVESMTSNWDCSGVQKIALWQNTNETIGASAFLGGMATISSFAVSSAPFTKNSTSVMVPSSYWTVYASDEQMILACEGNYYNSGGSGETIPSPETYLIAFKVAGASVNAMTLGKVPGSVMTMGAGTSSVDHIKKNGVDYVRVVTTSRPPMEFDEFGMCITSNVPTTAQLTVLEMTGGSDGMMPVVGQLEGLGKPGDSIYAIRFLGDQAFVVTFNYTDPFYTIDLSDPTSPVIVGELEVPGFSTYLHAVGENLILGVGRSTDELDMPVNFQLSLFDVSDFSNPRRVQFYEVNTTKSENVTTSVYSEADYDAKAFRFLEDSNILIIPMRMDSYTMSPCDDDWITMSSNFTYDDDFYTNFTDEWVTDRNATSIPVMESSDNSTMAPSSWSMDSGCYSQESTGDSFDGFRLFKIDALNGITEHFSIKHATGDYMSNGCYGMGFLSPRSFVFDGNVMTMKGHTVQSHDVLTKAEAAAPLDLDEGVSECSEEYYMI